jgi:tRNA (guanine10-N2)-methyltransferase
VAADIAAVLSSGRTFCFDVQTFGTTLAQTQKLAIMDSYSVPLHPAATVSLASPDTVVGIFEDHGEGHSLPLRAVLVGRRIAAGGRHAALQYTLKKRRYLGPTSMDAELAAIMANQAQITPGSVVLDPFTGTGSVLVAAAAAGAVCIGGDLNWLVLTARSPRGHGITDNFTQYSLPPPMLLNADFTRLPLRCAQQAIAPLKLDAIVCDPPYGIRAGSRSSDESNALAVAPTEMPGAAVAPDTRDAHVSRLRSHWAVPSVRRSLVDIYVDLTTLAARSLRPGGRLVYWLPTVWHMFDADADIPRHPWMDLICYSEQNLSGQTSRILVTCQRNAQPADTDCPPAAYVGDQPPAHHAFDGRKDILFGSVPEGAEARSRSSRRKFI